MSTPGNELAALADRISETPAYTADDLHCWRKPILHRCDQPDGNDDVSVILIDAGQRDAIVTALRLAATRPDTGAVWHASNEPPSIEPGEARQFIAAVYRKHSDKVYTFAAEYLNLYRLRYENGCPKGAANYCDECVEGCLTTGWFREEGADDDGTTYHSLDLRDGDRMEGWREIPRWEDRADALELPAKAAGDNLDARFERLKVEAADLGYVLAPEPEHPDSPHAPAKAAGDGGAMRDALERVLLELEAEAPCVAYDIAAAALAREEIGAAGDTGGKLGCQRCGGWGRLNVNNQYTACDLCNGSTDGPSEPSAPSKRDEPVAWSIIFNDNYGVNPETTFKTREKAELYVKACGNGTVTPLYAHPRTVDAESIANLLWEQFCPGIRQTETDLYHYRKAATAIAQLVAGVE